MYVCYVVFVCLFCAALVCLFVCLLLLLCYCYVYVFCVRGLVVASPHEVLAGEEGADLITIINN